MKYYNNYEDLSKLKIDEIYRLKFGKSPYGQELTMELVVKITDVNLDYTLRTNDLEVMKNHDKSIPEKGIKINFITIMSNDPSYVKLGSKLHWVNLSDISYFEDFITDKIDKENE